jgi:hypothetical protein
MNVQTHLFLAAAMERHIYKKYKVKLSEGYFYYGNIRPDLKFRSQKKIPHTYRDSFPYFYRDWKAMRKARMFRSLNVFSYKLGMMLHYTGDFFTYVHYNEKLFHKTVQHYQYERMLYQAFLHSRRGNPRLPQLGDDVKTFFEESLALYACGRSKPEHDANFIYFASVAVCDALMEDVYLKLRGMGAENEKR